jgi:hypothetical protein
MKFCVEIDHKCTYKFCIEAFLYINDCKRGGIAEFKVMLYKFYEELYNGNYVYNGLLIYIIMNL